MVPGVPCVDRGNWDESAKDCVIIWPPFVIYRTLCFIKTVLRKLTPYTLISHTDAHVVRGRPH